MLSLRENGYTLIELLVVIALLAGLSSVVLINNSEARNQAQLQTAAKQLESALTQAQAYGNSGRASKSGDFDAGYGVFLTTASGKDDVIRIYEGLGDIDGDGIDEDEEKFSAPATQTFEVIQLGGNVVIGEMRKTNPGNGIAHEAHILFRRGEAEAHLYSHNQSVNELKITLASGTATIDIFINKTGLFYIDQ